MTHVLVDPLKCVRRRIHSSRHSAGRWWMERKLEEDVANTAPATCVPLDLFGVFERKLWDSNLQKQEKFQSINLKQLCALSVFICSCALSQKSTRSNNIRTHSAILAGSFRLLSGVQIDEANYHNPAFWPALTQKTHSKKNNKKKKNHTPRCS